MKLTQWAVVYLTGKGDGYRPPETCARVLKGIVQGHPKMRDGREILTSIIAQVNGRTINTISGSTYELVGDPEPGYLEYLGSIGKEYDAENPIKVRS